MQVSRHRRSLRRLRRRLRLTVAGLVAGLLVLALAPLSSSTASASAAAPNPPDPASPDPLAASASGPAGQVSLDSVEGLDGGPHTITLVTGDSVRLEKVGGKYAVHPLAVPRPDGTRAQLSVLATPDGVYVTPSDAAAAIRSGRLDRELFNVSYLAENGYTDEESTDLPVIVQYPRSFADGTVMSSAGSIPASRPGVTLESINGAGLAVPKAEAGTFWTSLRAEPDPADRTRPGQPDQQSTLRRGVTKLWLDRRVSVDLDTSVPMIGAPDVWAAGFDGTGVVAAVLDTGIDDSHPDLSGKVVGAKSFIPGQQVQDGHGHGTHVASTIVGSGAASGGSYTGVAPGAGLLVGKVLDDSGNGTDSGAIEGMEWAAANGATVISMSLGSGPTDGTDPASQAVNALSASTGALFVIAAGNSGAGGAETVSSPGVADAALTVSAVDKSDGWADFSSRGPRQGDGALKPDIAAPGVAITAARATGTAMGTPLDDHYTAAAGTSMATPHVAGAAVLLAHQHPDWDGARLKAALMSTAKDDQLSVYQQGAGRVDVARAHQQSIIATTPSVDFASVEAEDAPSTRELVYANDGDQATTLSLSVNLRRDGGAVVEGAVSVADQELTVPAGGTASSTITLDPGLLAEIGTYSGAVVATGAGVSVRTPIGAVRARPMANLTVHTLNRTGRPANPWAQLTLDVSGDAGAIAGTYLIEEGTSVTRVPLGVVSVAQYLNWVDDGDRDNMVLLQAPEITITEDTEITLDARGASELTFSTPSVAEPLNNLNTIAFQRTVAGGDRYQGFVDNSSYWRLWATPTEPVTIGELRMHSRFTLGQPEVAMKVRNGRPIALHPAAPIHGYSAEGEHLQDTSFPDFRPFTGTRELPVVDVGLGRPEDIAGKDLRGKLVLLEADPVTDLFGNPSCGVRIERMGAVRDAGATAVVAFPTAGSGCGIPLSLTQEQYTGPTKPVGIPNVSLPSGEALALRDRLADGPLRIEVTGTPESPHTYTFAPYHEGSVPQSLHYSFGRSDLAQVDLDVHVTGSQRYSDWRYARKTDDVIPLSSGVNSWGVPRLTLTERRDWVGPLDPEVLSSHGMFVIPDLASFTQEDTVTSWALELIDRPSRTEQSWATTPFTPGAATGGPWLSRLATEGAELGESFRCMICVRDGKLWAEFEPSQGGPGRRHYNDQFWNGPFVQDFELHLYQGDHEIPRAPVLGVDFLPHYALPDQTGRYRLTAQNPQHEVEWTFSTAVGTEPLPGAFCTLEAIYGAADRCRPAPVVFVSYDLGTSLDAANTVPAGRIHRFQVSPYHSPSAGPMPEIAGLKLWASTDDGESYRRVPVRRAADGSYTATARYPDSGSGFVTLKVQAWDEAGNTVEQITRRAFGLRPAGG